MKRIVIGIICVTILTGLAVAQTQSAPAGGGATSSGGTTVSSGIQMGSRGLSADQFNALQDYAQTAKRLTQGENKGKTLEDLLAEDKAAAEALVKAMPLACTVERAVLAAEGPENLDGKTIATRTYEAACSNGMGYFLISREGAAPTGFSCLAADATRKADLAAGRQPGIVCGLPETGNAKQLAANVINRAGTACTVRDIRYVGLNAAAHIEFDEVACSDNTGYVMTAALPGSTAAVRVMSCRDSALKGLACKLSDNGGVLTSVENFKQALQTRHIACTAGEHDVHVVGQENTQKRYVVEFRCTERPQGLVAFIPPEGSTAPFEAVDCSAAVKRGVTCTLTTKK